MGKAVLRLRQHSVGSILRLMAFGTCLIVVLLSAFVMVNTAEDTCSFGEDGSWGGRVGTPSWSWWPLGQICTYDIEVRAEGGGVTTIRHVDRPSPFLSTTIVLLVVAGPLVLRRHTASDSTG